MTEKPANSKSNPSQPSPNANPITTSNANRIFVTINRAYVPLRYVNYIGPMYYYAINPDVTGDP